MNTETITPSGLLARAAELIGERGWHQGDYGNDDGCVCAIGALRAAAAEASGLQKTAVDRAVFFEHFIDRTVFDVMVDATTMLDEASPCRAIDIWNDQAGRTADEVVALMRHVAEAGDPK